MRAAHQAVWGGSGPPPPGVSLVRPGGLCVRILALGPWRATANGRPTLKQKGGEAWSPGPAAPLPPVLKVGYRGLQLPVYTATSDGAYDMFGSPNTGEKPGIPTNSPGRESIFPMSQSS